MAEICLSSCSYPAPHIPVLPNYLQDPTVPFYREEKPRLLRDEGAGWSPRVRQWQSWHWKPDCGLLCNTRTYVQLLRTACLHSLVSSQDLEKYQFCSSRDLTRELVKWKQLALSFMTRASSLIPSPPPQISFTLVGHRARGRGHGSGGRWGFGIPRRMGRQP
jgi:hypothetical protein